MNDEERKRLWFICKSEPGDSEAKPVYSLRYIVTVIRKDEEYDAYFCVTMANNLNSPDNSNSRLEWITDSDRFGNKRDAQMEILLRERFNR